MNHPALKTFGISDDDVRRERKLQVNLYRATINLLAALNDINRESCMVNVCTNAFRDFVHDELPFKLTGLGQPDFTHWDTKITEARNEG